MPKPKWDGDEEPTIINCYIIEANYAQPKGEHLTISPNSPHITQIYAKCISLRKANPSIVKSNEFALIWKKIIKIIAS